MSDPILCQYRWTLDEFVIANEQHRRYHRTVRQLIILIWLSAVLTVVIGIARLISLGPNRTSAALIFVGGLIMVLRWFGGRNYERLYAQLPDRDQEIRWQIFPDRFIVETPTSKFESAWSRISNMLRTEHGFLLYPQAGVFYWLPFHSFLNPVDIECMEKLPINRQPIPGLISVKINRNKSD